MRQVMLFADRLEIWNPGELPPSLTPESLRLPHASIPHNPLLAEPLFLTRHIEKAGTGILDMIGLCKTAKLRPPEFRQESGQFIQTLWRPKISMDTQADQHSEMHDGVHDEVHDGVHDLRLTELMRKILARLATPASTPELLKTLGYPRRTRNYSAAMKALLDAGMIAMTQPDVPRSKNQKYRLTDKGQTRLTEGGDTGSA